MLWPKSDLLMKDEFCSLLALWICHLLLSGDDSRRLLALDFPASASKKINKSLFFSGFSVSRTKQDV